jgi:acid stress-induced BolA-like protein IbaG/YrbA
MNAQALEALIEANIDNTKAIVKSDDNVHFEAIVISDSFNSIASRVKRQQMVYKALGDKIATGEVHALQLQTFTPNVWERKQQSK